MKFYFIGYSSEYDGVAYTRYGQSQEMPEERGEALIAGHPPALLLPEYIWNNLGFSEKELGANYSVLLHSEAPAEFKNKTEAARHALHDYRMQLAAKIDVENHVSPVLAAEQAGE